MAQPTRPRRGEETTDKNTKADAAREGMPAAGQKSGSAPESQGPSVESRPGGNGHNGIADKLRDQVNARLSSRKDRALDGVGGVTAALRETSQTLRDNQHDMVAQYLERAVGQVDRLAQTLRQKDVRELMDGAQRLAQRQPAVFVGSAFGIGLLAARFFKSSPPEHDEDTYYSAGEYRTRGMSSPGPEPIATEQNTRGYMGPGATRS